MKCGHDLESDTDGDARPQPKSAMALPARRLATARFELWARRQVLVHFDLHRIMEAAQEMVEEIAVGDGKLGHLVASSLLAGPALSQGRPLRGRLPIVSSQRRLGNMAGDALHARPQAVVHDESLHRCRPNRATEPGAPLPPSCPMLQTPSPSDGPRHPDPLATQPPALAKHARWSACCAERKGTARCCVVGLSSCGQRRNQLCRRSAQRATNIAGKGIGPRLHRCKPIPAAPRRG